MKLKPITLLFEEIFYYKDNMKVEYPPLLQLGFHQMTLEQLRVLCVDSFPLSRRRPVIMNNLEQVVNELRTENIVGRVWINGSSLTKKIEPEDSDILLHFSGEFADKAMPQQNKIIEKIKDNLKGSMLCDSDVLPYYSQGHEAYNMCEWWKAYWVRQCGFTQMDKPKGIAVVGL